MDDDPGDDEAPGEDWALCDGELCAWESFAFWSPAASALAETRAVPATSRCVSFIGSPFLYGRREIPRAGLARDPGKAASGVPARAGWAGSNEPYQPIAAGSQSAIWGKKYRITRPKACMPMKGSTPR